MLETAREQSFPQLTQISFFLPNKVGSLERITSEFEQLEVKVCGMSILDAHDHAVVRMIVDEPGKATLRLEERGHRVCTSQVLGVAVPDGVGAVPKLLGCLVRAELNVHYGYALLSRLHGQPILVFHADDVGMAQQVVVRGGFELVTQDNLKDS